MSDPFDILGVPPRFDLDAAALEARHRELSRALHPDRHMGESPAHRRLALGKAIEVNSAFRTLKDPLRRAEALLQRAGVTVGETGEPKPPPELLMEMMELREELAEARRSEDSAQIAALKARVEERRASTMQKLAARLDAGPPAHALPALGELRYLRRFLDEVALIEEELS